MPPKIRELKARLRKAGFSSRPGKGSHTVFTHPKLPGARCVLAGSDGDDAKRYQEEDVQDIWSSYGRNYERRRNERSI